MTELKLIYSGKVRDIYDAGDGNLLFVASDRLSVFDVVLAETVPEKGRALTAISAFWFDELAGVLEEFDLRDVYIKGTPRPDFLPRRPALTYWISSGEGLNFSPRVRCRYSRMCRRVSRPTRSTSSNGPMGWLSPSLSALSISAAEAIPSCSM